jgi:hypothetical protein
MQSFQVHSWRLELMVSSKKGPDRRDLGCSEQTMSPLLQSFPSLYTLAFTLGGAMG